MHRLEPEASDRSTQPTCGTPASLEHNPEADALQLAAGLFQIPSPWLVADQTSHLLGLKIVVEAPPTEFPPNT